MGDRAALPSLRRRQPHQPVHDRRPLERALLEPLPDQHQPGAIPRSSFTRSARFERKTKIVPENGSWASVSLASAASPSMPFRKSTGLVATSTRTPRRYDHADFTARSTAPRKPMSTPGATRTNTPPTSISTLPPPSRFGRCVRHRDRDEGGDRAIADDASRRKLPPPRVELIGMNPAAQRDPPRHRAWGKALGDDRRLLFVRPPPSPRRPAQHLDPAETLSLRWQITWVMIHPRPPSPGDKISRKLSAAARWERRTAYTSLAAAERWVGAWAQSSRRRCRRRPR